MENKINWILGIVAIGFIVTMAQLVRMDKALNDALGQAHNAALMASSASRSAGDAYYAANEASEKAGEAAENARDAADYAANCPGN